VQAEREFFLFGSHIVQVNALLGNALLGSFGASASINVGFANSTFPRSMITWLAYVVDVGSSICMICWSPFVDVKGQ